MIPHNLMKPIIGPTNEIWDVVDHITLPDFVHANLSPLLIYGGFGGFNKIIPLVDYSTKFCKLCILVITYFAKSNLERGG